MTERNRGLFYPDGEYKTEKQVKRKLALEGNLPPVIEGGQERKSFKDFITIAIHRSKDAREFSPSAQGSVKITVPDHAILNWIPDTHLWHPNTDHERLFEEVETVMETPRSYFAWGGDLVHGIHWGGAGGTEQVGSLDEQKRSMDELWRRTAGRSLLAVPGEHDEKWAARTGGSPYTNFNELTKGGVYKRGVMELEIEAGENTFYGALSHKLRGSSIYNNLHPTMRFVKENEGYDFVLSGHTHRKAVGQQPRKTRGDARMVTYGVGGPYMRGGEYSQRSGWKEQETKELYGVALRFDPETKKIEIEEDILYANKKWG